MRQSLAKDWIFVTTVATFSQFSVSILIFGIVSSLYRAVKQNFTLTHLKENKIGLLELVLELNEFFKQFFFFKFWFTRILCSSSSPDDCTRNIEIDRVDTPPTFISRESTIINLPKSILNKIYFQFEIKPFKNSYIYTRKYHYLVDFNKLLGSTHNSKYRKCSMKN